MLMGSSSSVVATQKPHSKEISQEPAISYKGISGHKVTIAPPANNVEETINKRRTLMQKSLSESNFDDRYAITFPPSAAVAFLSERVTKLQSLRQIVKPSQRGAISPNQKLSIEIITRLFANGISQFRGTCATTFEDNLYAVTYQPGTHYIHRVLEEVGAGSCATVFRLEDLATGTISALKLSEKNPEQIDSEVNNLDVLHSGSSAWGLQKQPYLVISLSHPLSGKGHLGAFYESDYFGFLKSSPRVDLFSSTGKLTEAGESRLSHVHQLLSTLCRMDGCKMIHGDIKPENILYEPSQDPEKPPLVHLADYGGAVVYDEERARCTPEYTTPAFIHVNDIKSLPSYKGSVNRIGKIEGIFSTARVKRTLLKEILKKIPPADFERKCEAFKKLQQPGLPNALQVEADSAEALFLCLDESSRQLVVGILSLKPKTRRIALRLFKTTDAIDYSAFRSALTKTHAALADELAGISACTIIDLRSSLEKHEFIIKKKTLREFKIRQKMDIFALGILLHEVWSVKTPSLNFQAPKPIQPAGKKRVSKKGGIAYASGEIRIAYALIPPEFHGLILSMLDSDYKKRPTSQECLDQLIKILENYPEKKAQIEQAVKSASKN